MQVKCNVLEGKVDVTEFFAEPLSKQHLERRVSSFALNKCRDLIVTKPNGKKVILAKDYSEIIRRYNLVY